MVHMNSSRRLPSLNALRVLEAIRETGSVSAAARRLSVSHSAISHQIKQLEGWIGRPITVRHGRSVALTDAGESLARVVHTSFDAIRHEIDLLPMRFARAVSISALPIIAEEILLPNLAHFRQIHPNISMHLSLAQTDRPKTPSPDIEISFNPHDRMLPTDTRLFSGDAVPVCAPEFLQAAGNDPAKAVAYGPLLADEDSRMWSSWLSKMPEAWSPNETARTIYFEGSFLLQMAAEQAIGIAICRKATIARALRTNRLVQLSDVAIDQDWSYTMRVLPGRVFEPEVMTVTDWLVALGD
jgi:LysR family glycine cleavage system transcriptional activator